MTALRLREGWEVQRGRCWNWIHRVGEDVNDSYASCSPDGLVIVYPFGGRQLEDCRFDSIEEAHAYLISVGSESPWEVTP